VDGQPWNASTLYAPNDEHLVVGCRRCDRNSTSELPDWFYPNNTLIPSCDNTNKLQICTQTNESIKTLEFLPFKKSVAGEYRCASTLKINIELGKLIRLLAI